VSAHAAATWPAGSLRGETAKLAAFLRRDMLVAWSYRMAFFSDLATLVAQMLLFYYIGKLVPADRLPSYGGVQADYIDFVTLGIVINVFVQVALTRTSSAMRQEQLMGTLESLLVTPTAAATVQLGSAVFDLVYMPLRTAVFLAFMVMFVGVDLDPSGILPSIVLLLAFIPCIWGIGIGCAAGILTFKRGAGAIGLGALLLGFTSGAFFPLTLLPEWVQTLAAYNPLAVAVEGLRDALLGGTGWAGVSEDILKLVPMSVIALVTGSILFRLAMRREQRRGTLGLY
jgi:ABC-2 type transport system permease protein